MSELTTLFKNTADAIRSKTGDTETMQASQFPAKIQGISVGISQDEADARYLQLSGGTMTGDLILNGAPTADNQAATKAYVDSKAGGTNRTIIYTNQNFRLLSSDSHAPFDVNFIGQNLIGKRWLIIELSSTTGDTTINMPFGLRIGGFYILNDMNGLSGNVSSPLTFYVPIGSFRCNNKQPDQFTVYADFNSNGRLNEPNYPSSLLKLDIYSGTNHSYGPYNLTIYVE